MEYRHYSFDVWLTLIRSNPDFRHKRTAYFAQHFNPLGRTLSQVSELIREVDLSCTRINELVGKNIDSLELFLLMAQRLGTDLNQLTNEQLMATQHDLSDMFRKYPPRLTDEKIPLVLSTLRSRGITLSLLSNTGLIRGASLRQYWEELGIGELFAFQLYSDEVGLSKPNPAFYAMLYQKARQLSEYQSDPLQSMRIIHIGDNPVADEAGARAAKLSTLLIHPDKPEFSKLLL